MTAEPFLKEADSYFGIVNSNLTKKRRFNNKVLYSLSTMVIEKYLVALLTADGVQVSGHTIGGLLASSKQRFNDIPESLDSLIEMDKKSNLCSFDPVDEVEPNDTEMTGLLENLVVLKQYVYTKMN